MLDLFLGVCFVFGFSPSLRRRGLRGGYEINQPHLTSPSKGEEQLVPLLTKEGIKGR